ncbi:radical SAM protein [bacterium]|nr:radical SAM protein [bacterium]|tara:strand:- start:10126 stop:11280 length:1155 start_codon:yes stop_codon:yes gene_type:complete
MDPAVKVLEAAQAHKVLSKEASLTKDEVRRRKDQSQKRPRVHQKIQSYFENMLDGAISPILRLKINRSACNMACQHCCEEPYMSRDLLKKTGKIDPRKQMDLADYKKLSDEADELGLFRFVITGGEALLDRNLGDLITTLDPYKHLIILDTNGYFFNEEKAKWFAELGGYKVQISLDSYYKEEHDAFRSTEGAYDRAINAFKVAKNAGLELLMSTCLVRDRVFSKEFERMMAYCAEEEIPLYVTLAKPVGSARGHEEWVCTKKDVDQLKYLEDKHNIFTHMTPNYGQPGKCITVKGINTVNHDGEIVPCPYMDLSIGNVTKEPLKVILDRGMKNKWLGPYRDECIIGENFDFIKFHNDSVQEHLRETPYLPVPYEKGFALNGSV